LTKLDFRQSHLSQKNMNEVLSELKLLKTLLLRNTKWNFTGNLQIHMPELVTLDIGFMQSNTAASISVECPKLASVFVTQFCGSSNHSLWLQSIHIKSQQLLEVDVSSISLVTMECPKLESLTAYSMPDGVKTEILKKLRLSTCDVHQESKLTTSDFPALEHVVLHSFVGLSNTSKKFTNLKTIQTYTGSAHGVGDTFIESITRLQVLEGVHIVGTDLKFPVFKHLKLRELFLQGNKITKATITIDTPGLESLNLESVSSPILSLMPKITQLRLFSVKFKTSKDFEIMLQNLPQLKKLKIDRCHSLNELTIEHLSLEELSVEECNRIKSCSIVALKLKHLELMTLKFLSNLVLQCTDDLKLVNFRGCKHVTDQTFPEETLPFPGVIQICFAWTGITNVTLKKMVNHCPFLQQINLKGCPNIPTLLKKVILKKMCNQHSIAGKPLPSIHVSPILDYFPQ